MIFLKVQQDYAYFVGIAIFRLLFDWVLSFSLRKLVKIPLFTSIKAALSFFFRLKRFLYVLNEHNFFLF